MSTTEPMIRESSQPVPLPKVLGRPYTMSGTGTVLRGHGLYRRDEGERDTCQQVTIQGYTIHDAITGMDLSQARQLRIRDCNFVNCTTGISLHFALATQIENCRFQCRGTGVRLGSGTSEQSHVSVLRNCRFFGGQTQVLIDGTSQVVFDQCTFEGRGSDVCVKWLCHQYPTARNLTFRNCYWETVPKVAAIYVDGNQSGMVTLEQPEIHPAGGGHWTFLKASRGCTNMSVRVSNAVTWAGKIDTVVNQGDIIRGIRYLTWDHCYPKRDWNAEGLYVNKVRPQVVSVEGPRDY